MGDKNARADTCTFQLEQKIRATEAKLPRQEAMLAKLREMIATTEKIIKICEQKVEHLRKKISQATTANKIAALAAEKARVVQRIAREKSEKRKLFRQLSN